MSLEILGWGAVGGWLLTEASMWKDTGSMRLRLNLVPAAIGAGSYMAWEWMWPSYDPTWWIGILVGAGGNIALGVLLGAVLGITMGGISNIA